MIFYTKQSKQIVKLLSENDEVFSLKPNKDDFFYKSYRYMNQQLDNHIKKTNINSNKINKHSIFWGVNNIDDMEDMAQGELLVFNIPDEYILISDYMAWHYVLNNCPFVYGEEEDGWNKNKKINNKNKKKLIKKTWLGIFDIKYNSKSKEFIISEKIKNLYECSSPILQLCVKSLKKEWLVKMEND